MSTSLLGKRKSNAPDSSCDKDYSPRRDSLCVKRICIENCTAPQNAKWGTEWIPATSTRNYMMRDSLVDWLDLYGENKKYTISTSVASPSLNNTNVNNPSVNNVASPIVNTNPQDLYTILKDQGKIFEKNVVNLLKKRFKKALVSLAECDPKLQSSVEQTVNEMKKCTPIIHNACVHDVKNKTYGIIDLLVRSDYINKITKTSYLEKKDIDIQAPNLSKYHYRVIDIKFSTLNLCANGINVLNIGRIPAYKTQLWIYNQAIGNIQGYTPPCTYLLGRRYRYISQGDEYCGNTCFEKLGVIEYNGRDHMYETKSREAIKWVKNVRKPSASKWNIDTFPLSRPELYPNMSARFDQYDIKKKIADKNKEITSLWMVGTKHRDYCLEQGIYSWDDPKFSIKTLKFKDTSICIPRILEPIININRQNNDLILPKKIQSNMYMWRIIEPIEFYIDFETCSDIIDDIPSTVYENDIFGISSTMKCNNYNIVIMIGVSHWNGNEFVYKNFTSRGLSFAGEKEIYTGMINYITDICVSRNVSFPRLIHWSSAEKNLVEKMSTRHNISINANWMDLMLLFKNEPIVIKDCFSFSLKNIAKAMYKHKFISTCWDEDSICSDGMSAMVAAWKVYQSEYTGHAQDHPDMIDVIKYNEIDIRVLYEILGYLRCNH